MNDRRVGQLVQKTYLLNRQAVSVTDAVQCFTGCDRVILFLRNFLGNF
jgi:hypothetical protein